MTTCHVVTLEQLLSVRDGEPVDAHIPLHVQTCELCSKELSRVRNVQSNLRALPALAAPAFDRRALQLRLRALEQPRASARHITTIAASLSAIVVAIAISSSVQNQNNSTEIISQPAVEISADSNEPSDAPIKSWVIRSQDLDSRLRYLPRRPHVQRVSTSATIDSLQSRIQWVDYQLSLADDVGLTESQSAQLWQDRVQLMDTLVKVRSAEAQRFAALQ